MWLPPTLEEKPVARLRLFASLVIIFLLAVPVLAGNESTGTVGAAFLKLGQGVRAPSMGEAFTAVADDATAISWNPAGLAKSSSSEISTTYNIWLLDTSYSTIHYIKPWGPGTLGAALFYLSYGSIAETTDTQRLGTGRTFTPSAYVATLAWGQALNKDLSLGASAKIFNQNIDSFNEGGAALDAGVLYSYKPWDLRLGGVIQNIGGTLPQTIKMGASKVILDNRLNLALDLNLPKDNKTYISFGGEFKVVPQLVIRAGYNTKSEEGAGGNLGIGLGLNLSRFSVDYGYVPYGDLGNAHRIGLRVGL
jgi:hypothetical protein